MGLNRRVWLGQSQLDGRPWAAAEGVAGEDFETEVYAPYGFASGVEGEGVLIPFNLDDDNHTALGPRGDRIAQAGTVLVYYGDSTEIELSESGIVIRVEGGEINIGGGKITTDMDIETSGDVKAGSISLKSHVHGQVQSGMAISGVAR